MNMMLFRRVCVLLVLCGLTRRTEPSIAGVTYRDHFDFEQRYANPHECNPIYWHPLHLPEHCAAKFEKMIRTHLYSTAKLQKEEGMERIINTFKKNLSRQRKHHSIEKSYDYNTYYDTPDAAQESTELSSFPFEPNSYEHMNVYSAEFDLPASNIIQRKPWPAQPYDRMLRLMRKEVERHPVAPFIGLVPYVGLSAIYRQPVSQQTVDVIKKTAKAYADMAVDTGILPKPGEVPTEKESNKTADDEMGFPQNEDIKKELKEIKEFILERKKELKPVASVDLTD